MVDVSDKAETARVAMAAAWVKMAPETYEIVSEGRAEEGRRSGRCPAGRDHGRQEDARSDPAVPPAARQQGGGGADARPDLPGVAIEATVKTTGQTGVEMEALTAASARGADGL